MEFSEIFECDNEKAKETAQRAQQLKIAFDGGIITRSEYNELVEDLVDIRTIESLKLTIEQKAFWNEVFQTILGFCKHG